MSTIFWASDSTVAYNSIKTYPQTGMGQVLNLFLKPSIKIENHAKNGRSTKSFIDENLLMPIYFNIKENDFLFIQFGHNDEKKSDPNRYTDPQTTYKENLKKYINVATNKKAFPLLITPLERRWFKDGKLLTSDHGPYVKAMKEIAKEENVPLIDLFSLSRKLIEDLGDNNSKKLFMQLKINEFKNFPNGIDDNTHLRYEGAIVFAQIIAEELAKLKAPYKDLLLE